MLPLFFWEANLGTLHCVNFAGQCPRCKIIVTTDYDIRNGYNLTCDYCKCNSFYVESKVGSEVIIADFKYCFVFLLLKCRHCHRLMLCRPTLTHKTHCAGLDVIIEYKLKPDNAGTYDIEIPWEQKGDRKHGLLAILTELEITSDQPE